MKVTLKNLVRGNENDMETPTGEMVACWEEFDPQFDIPNEAKRFDLELSTQRSREGVAIWLHRTEGEPEYCFGRNEPNWKREGYFFTSWTEHFLDKLRIIPKHKARKYYLTVYYYEE